MPISYSFHLSNKSNSVGTIGKVGQCSRHNLREYKSEKYDRSLIEVLRGSESSILDDVKKIYHDEFDQCLEAYNKGKRADRQIHDYLQHVSDSRSDVAAEIIIQLGDKDFWADKTMEEKKQMSYVFVDQLRSLEKLCPEFKIASAVVHYDEASPHMHIVGVPVAEGYKKGMPKQVAKTKVFTADRLSYLQDRMRENMERGMELNQNLFADQELKEKEKGRNRDIPKEALETYYEMKKQTEDLQRQADQLQTDTEKQKIKLQVAGDAYGYIAERAQDHEIPEIEIKEITVRDSVFQSHKEYHLIIPENTLEEAEERKKEVQRLYVKQYAKESFDAAYNQAEGRAIDRMDKAKTEIQNAHIIWNQRNSIIAGARSKANELVEAAKSQADKILQEARETYNAWRQAILNMEAEYNRLKSSLSRLHQEKQEAQLECDQILQKRAQLEPLREEIEELENEYNILSGKMRYEYAKKLFTPLDKSLWSSYLRIGDLVAFYNNGTVKVLEDVDYRVEEDANKGRCRIGIMQDTERNVEVPQSLFREMVSKLDQNKKMSEQLYNLVIQEQYIEQRQSRPRPHRR